MRSPLLLALLAITALAVTGFLLVGGGEGDAVAPTPLAIAPSDLPVGAERIYEGDLASTLDGVGYRLDAVGCEADTCTAVVTATNEGDDPVPVETRYFLVVDGQRISPIDASGAAFGQDLPPGEPAEVRVRFSAPGSTLTVTQFEIGDTVRATGILFDL